VEKQMPTMIISTLGSNSWDNANQIMIQSLITTNQPTTSFTRSPAWDQPKKQSEVSHGNHHALRM
jgi:hypothetical protein